MLGAQIKLNKAWFIFVITVAWIAFEVFWELILKYGKKSGTHSSSQKDSNGNEIYGYVSLHFPVYGKVQLLFSVLTTETALTLSGNNHSYNVPLLNPLIFPQVTYYYTELLLNSVSAAYTPGRMQIVYLPQD